MQVTGDVYTVGQKYDVLLTGKGWSGPRICGHGDPGTPPRYHWGLLPWDREWKATIEYDEHGPSNVYIVVTVWKGSNVPGDCGPSAQSSRREY
jgi:hypothetical protein